MALRQCFFRSWSYIEHVKTLHPPGFRKPIPLSEDCKECLVPITEAHHIDYYVKSLNNDANNQMVVCPNHHSIIHEANPKFNRKKMMYLYPNGAEQRIVLICI